MNDNNNREPINIEPEDIETIDPIYETDYIREPINDPNNIYETIETPYMENKPEEREYRTYKPINQSIVTPETYDYNEATNTQSYDRGDYSANFNSNNYTQQVKQSQPPRKRPIRKFFRFVALFVVFVFLGGVIFGAGYGSAIYLGAQLTPDLVESTNTLTFDVNRIEPVISTSANIETSTNVVASIAKTAGPSVVTVTSSFSVNSNNLFGRSNNEVEGTGSGIIYELRDTDLLIVTNHHVIEDANSVEITFYDGITLDADIIGYDSQMDLAVVSIPLSVLDNSDVEDITVATFGDSELLEVGELAVAIGNPLGKEFSTTVTAGVISAVDRQLTIDNTELHLIQTDAAINPGNSGGALLNASGEVIGINTAKYIDESVEGMGFSIPTHLALPTITEIIESSSGTDISPETVTQELSSDRPFLGVGIDDITDEIYNQTNMPFGVYVTKVFENSAADEAGLEVGDVIYSIDGERLNNTDDLFSVLSEKVVGDTIKISVARGEDVHHLEATLTKASDVIITN